MLILLPWKFFQMVRGVQGTFTLKFMSTPLELSSGQEPQDQFPRAQPHVLLFGSEHHWVEKQRSAPGG